MTFYYHLRPNPDYPGRSLEEHYSQAKIGQGFLMSKDTIKYNKIVKENFKKETLVPSGKTGKAYALFESYIEAFNYIQGLDIPQRTFYEVIDGVVRQKHHFDLDFKNISEKESTAALSLFLLVLNKVWLELYPLYPLNFTRNILIYSSHGMDLVGSESKMKYSYHIIIDLYACSCHQEAKNLFDHIYTSTSKIEGNEILLKALDGSVYSSLQNFRLLGCQKYGKNRIKVFNSTFVVGEQTITHISKLIARNPRHLLLINFTASLISETSNCQSLPNLVAKEIKRIYSPDDYEIEDIIERSSEYILDLLHKYLFQGDEKDEEKECIFEIDSRYVSSPNIIPLKRLRPSYCPLCKHIHEGQTSFIHLHQNAVMYSCGRNQEIKSVYLGVIPTLNNADTDVVDINTIPSKGFALNGEKEIKLTPPISEIEPTPAIVEIKTPAIVELKPSPIVEIKTPSVPIIRNRPKMVKKYTGIDGKPQYSHGDHKMNAQNSFF